MFLFKDISPIVIASAPLRMSRRCVQVHVGLHQLSHRWHPAAGGLPRAPPGQDTRPTEGATRQEWSGRKCGHKGSNASCALLRPGRFAALSARESEVGHFLTRPVFSNPLFVATIKLWSVPTFKMVGNSSGVSLLNLGAPRCFYLWVSLNAGNVSFWYCSSWSSLWYVFFKKKLVVSESRRFIKAIWSHRRHL